MREITPQPGYVKSDVEDILSTRQYAYADCYTITPRYGDPINLTTRDRDVSVSIDSSPVTFSSNGQFTLEGIKLMLKVGVAIDEQEVSFKFQESSTLWGYSVRSAIRFGRFDGAKITRRRFFASGPGQPWVGSVLLFLGRVSNADSIQKTSCVFRVKSELILLKTRLPRDLYQPGCNHVLYDEGCGLDRESFKITAATESGTTASVIVSSSAVSSLRLGVLYIDNPDGITLVRSIRAVSGSNIELTYPLDFIPGVGVSFTAYQGCDRTKARCTALGNILNYKGYPYVPVAETAL